MKKIFLTLPYLTLIIFTSASFFLMLNAARTDSAIMDELAHIPAGYSYVKYLDYRLNPEHPPLVKIISAIPLLFANLNFPTDKSFWTTDINGQWTSGAQFLYESGNSADKILFLARLGPILLTLLLIIFIYFFARKLIGRWWALLPTFFVALSPNFLAHGHYVTTDVGATLGIFLAIFGLLNFLLNQSSKNLIISGTLFGIAQLMKFSSVLLIPYFIFIIFVFYLVSVIRDWPQVSAGNRFKKFGIRFIKYTRSLLAIFFIGYLLVYAVYFITTLNYPISRQVSDTTTTLQSFGMRPLANLNIWMAGNKIFRRRQYRIFYGRGLRRGMAVLFPYDFYYERSSTNFNNYFHRPNYRIMEYR
ncbi:MAG: hypothetical protein Athens071426_296 [Parcubacteria group bacterium Athens0714_26]|nr:MAG: hypothetical protein Athens071426_296 [Parcubacteria group bacterium Athens0714_26]